MGSLQRRGEDLPNEVRLPTTDSGLLTQDSASNRTSSFVNSPFTKLSPNYLQPVCGRFPAGTRTDHSGSEVDIIKWLRVKDITGATQEQ